MKTLADFKREMIIGKKMMMTSAYGKTEGGKIGMERHIIKTQTNGVYLARDPNSKEGSWLDYPKASLMEYDGKTLKTYDAGYRELTDEEKKVNKNMPSHLKENEQKVQDDMMTDGSQMYWTDKRYLKEQGMEHLSFSEHKGMKLDYDRDSDNRDHLMIRDDKVRGKEVLVYKIID
jgi:hypothetical protein